MLSFLKRLFSPRRTSAKAPKPVEIENLDPKRAQDREELFKLITASEATGQQITAALTKTGSLDVVVRWYVDAPDTVKAYIADWVARQNNTAARLAQARARLDDPQLQQVLDQLSGGLAVPATGTATTSQTTEQLEKQAIRARTSQERQQAAERLSDEATLQRVARAARGRDKGVYQIARQKLQVLREEAARVAAVHSELEKLIAQCETHARTESTQLYQPRLQSLIAAWEGSQRAATEEQRQRFETALALCQTRVDELAAQAQAAARAEARAQERRATLSLLRDTLQELKDTPPEQVASASALDALQRTQENRWLEATRESEVERQEQDAYEQLMRSLRQYLQAVQNFSARREDLRLALEEERVDALALLLADIAWPQGYSQPAEIAAAAARVKSKPTEKAEPAPAEPIDSSQIQALLDNLEQVLEQKELKPSRKLLKEAQHSLDQLPEKARRPFQGRLALLARQVDDLQDWQGFAIRPKQEALCEQMEHLASQHMEPELKAAKIHELQQQWRELGGSPDQALWQRFKQAADSAFAPCQDYFAARNELKAANLHRREQICNELSMFIAQVDWTSCDWRGVEKIHRRARTEWRDAKPIDFRQNRDVQRRFDDLLKQLDAHLSKERERNEAAKAEIVAKAQELASHEPLAEAMSQAKELQKAWEGIGITRQKQDRALWQSFRAACDTIFARRDKQRIEQQAQNSEQLAAAESVLGRIEQQLQASPEQQDQEAIGQLVQEFRELNLPANQRDGLNRRFQNAERQLEENARRAVRQEEERQWLLRLGQSRAANSDDAVLQEVCIRAEILAGIESPAEYREQRMTLQVERLAAGMGQGQNFSDTRAEMDHLVSLWQSNASPTPPPELLSRMKQAIEALQA